MRKTDVAAVADVVVLTIKSALAPVCERLADVRDRLETIETKAAIPSSQEMPQPVMRALEPVIASLASLKEQVAGWEARWSDIGALRERVAVVEVKAALPPVALEMRQTAPDEALVDLRARLALTEDIATKDATRIEGYTAFLQRDVAALSERTAVLETRAPVPGPPGKDGVNGTDGADGLGWDDLRVEHDGERGFTIKMVRGDQVKDAGTFTVPYMIYRGVYREGHTYTKGDMVTWAGSLWLVNDETSLKPDSLSKVYTLAVKKGQDGKDGRDATSIPVVSVGPR